MSEPTPKQINFIKSLCNARRSSLTPTPDWLKRPTTSREASVLIDLLMKIKVDVVADPELESKINRLRTGFNEVKRNDQTIAQSFLTQFDRKGTLSGPQQAILDKIISSMGQVDPDQGFYLLPDDTVVMVYNTRNGNVTTKSFVTSWEYTGRQGLSSCLPEYKMTGEQVAALGRRISKDGKGTCVVCLAEGRDPTLTDARSIAAGYGATCAARYGWHYPTHEEAQSTLSTRV